MKRLLAAGLISTLACGGDGGSTGTDAADEELSAGTATVFDDSRQAYAQALPALHGEREDTFYVGNAVFNRGWVTAPASVVDFDGLGPQYNATNCSACHLKDGRGRPPERADEPLLSMLVRLSVPGQGPHGEPVGEPSYGGQLQGSAVLDVPREANVRVRYEERPGRFADGERFSLREPHYSFEELAHGPLAKDVRFSPRVAPSVFGLGLLAAIDEATLEGLADPDDDDGDGISGRINHVWDVKAKRKAIGRFGWKANQPSLLQQSAGAFLGDMGISSSLFPDQDCSAVERECQEHPAGASAGQPELKDAYLEAVVSYMHTLAVPARRHVEDPDVRAGKDLFSDAGCPSCHVSELETGELAGFPELAHHVIRPYTDLLVHDMGEELADHRDDFEANGREWRTPPLWGLGLIRIVNRHDYLLHDGRARGALEAVLWHGGEAAASQKAVLRFSKEQRRQLVAFLESL